MIDVKCPECGSENILDVIYGYLPFDLALKKEAGEIIWGGLFIPDDPRKFHCVDCGHEW